jgi:hypothetical protein
MSELLDGYLSDLTGAEFKIASYLYRQLEKQEVVDTSITALSRATGVSWRQTQTCLQSLAKQGVLRVQGHKVAAPNAGCRPPCPLYPALYPRQSRHLGPYAPTLSKAFRPERRWRRWRQRKSKHGNLPLHSWACQWTTALWLRCRPVWIVIPTSRVPCSAVSARQRSGAGGLKK